jgi:hypothetical protein
VTVAHQPKGIRLPDPAKLGAAILILRERHAGGAGISRRALARKVALATGQPVNTVDSQLGRYEGGKVQRPDLPNVGPILAELGYDLALIPREDR